MKNEYKRQVALLLDVLPEVAREECFALHGGTAINLFVQEMPRLSVDIDLTYVPLSDRESSIEGINTGLSDIIQRLKKVKPPLKYVHQKKNLKIQLSRSGAQIKIEVNQINRGCISDPKKLTLCEKAQEMFDAFCTINVVPDSQLFGGKVIAALDRQHPRDLYDIRMLMRKGSINEKIKEGIVFCLLSSNRPVNELLRPNRKNQQLVLENQFEGMSAEVFTYEEFENTRGELIRTVNGMLKQADKDFILGFKGLDPDWAIYDFERFPAIQWKLENLRKFRETNPVHYKSALDRLTSVLE